MRSRFLNALWIGSRLEWLRLQANPATWLFAALLVGVGFIVGFLDTTSFGLHSLFDALQLGMFLTIVSAFWGWQATAAAVQPHAREILAARAVDEWTMHGARVVVTGLYGGLVTFAFYLALTVSRYYLLEPWWVGLRWLPVIVLAHTLAASLGGLAALLSVRRPGLGVPLTFGLWGAWVGLAQAFGPLWPDLFLRVLRWNNVLQDAAIEPLRWPLIVSFTLAISTVTTCGVLLLRWLEHRRIAVTPQGNLQTATQLGIALVLSASLLGLGTVWSAREGALTVRAETLNNPIESLIWSPVRSTLTLKGGVEQQVLHGPARPTAVAPRDFETFAPYLGRHGVVLPINRIEAGRYDFTVNSPSGWKFYGCSSTVPNGDGVQCRGEDATKDWLVILPDGALKTADRVMRSLDPSLYEAKILYDTSVRSALAILGRPVLEILPLGSRQPLWLSEKTLAGSTVFGEKPVMLRGAVHSAAVTVAANLLGVREPNEALYSTQDRQLAPNLPLALVAVLDRLLLELDAQRLDPLEASARRGEQVDMARRLYPFYPFDESSRPDYNAWWLATHDMIMQNIPVTDLWAALQGAGDWNGIETWNDLLPS